MTAVQGGERGEDEMRHDKTDRRGKEDAIMSPYQQHACYTVCAVQEERE